MKDLWFILRGIAILLWTAIVFTVAFVALCVCGSIIFLYEIGRKTL